MRSFLKSLGGWGYCSVGGYLLSVLRGPGFQHQKRRKRKKKKKSLCSLTHLKMFHGLALSGHTGLSPKSFFLCHVVSTCFVLDGALPVASENTALKSPPSFEVMRQWGCASSSVSVSWWTRRAGITGSTQSSESSHTQELSVWNAHRPLRESNSWQQTP